MKTELVSIKLVKSNPNNPRIIKDDKFAKLVASIKEFPKIKLILLIVFLVLVKCLHNFLVTFLTLCPVNSLKNRTLQPL